MVHATQAPEIVSPTWLNSQPLKLEHLRGKVVMVEFWTFGCWNCRNIEPYVKEWHHKYAKQGLVVIAVHSPEFKYEYDVEKVKAYIQEHNIPYAVPIDNEFLNWRQYRYRYWPTLYLIDKQGNIQYTHIGEGGYQETEHTLQRLLTEPALQEICEEFNKDYWYWYWEGRTGMKLRSNIGPLSIKREISRSVLLQTATL